MEDKDKKFWYGKVVVILPLRADISSSKYSRSEKIQRTALAPFVSNQKEAWPFFDPKDFQTSSAHM